MTLNEKVRSLYERHTFPMKVESKGCDINNEKL